MRKKKKFYSLAMWQQCNSKCRNRKWQIKIWQHNNNWTRETKCPIFCLCVSNSQGTNLYRECFPSCQAEERQWKESDSEAAFALEYDISQAHLAEHPHSSGSVMLRQRKSVVHVQSTHQYFSSISKQFLAEVLIPCTKEEGWKVSEKK